MCKLTIYTHIWHENIYIYATTHWHVTHVQHDEHDRTVNWQYIHIYNIRTYIQMPQLIDMWHTCNMTHMTALVVTFSTKSTASRNPPNRDTQIPRYLAVQIQIAILIRSQEFEFLKFAFVPRNLSFSNSQIWVSGIWWNMGVYSNMGWLRLVGSSKSQVSFAEYRLFYRALLQKRPIILSILLTKSTP